MIKAFDKYKGLYNAVLVEAAGIEPASDNILLCVSPGADDT